MKLKILLVTCALCVAGLGFAQSSEMPTKEQIKTEAIELTNEMTETLDLTDVQIERLKGMNMSTLSHVAKINAMSVSDAKKSEQMEVFMDKQEKTLSQILSEEQMEKYRSNYKSLYEPGGVSFDK